MITSKLAKKFAADWFKDPGDELAMVVMIAQLLQRVSTEATKLERERIQSKLAELIR
jgi:hypothetical protein